MPGPLDYEEYYVEYYVEYCVGQTLLAWFGRTTGRVRADMVGHEDLLGFLNPESGGSAWVSSMDLRRGF